MTILERIRSITNEPFYKIEDNAGLGRGTLYRWDESTPSAEKISLVAKYLNVTVDYLLNDGETPSEAANVYPVDSIVVFEEIGSVRAGYGSMAVEERTGKKIEIAKSMLAGRPAKDYFILRVKGNSMYPRLVEGDDILCLSCTSVDSGDYAVVLYNGDEATVKKVNYVNGEDWLELVPCNPEYAPRRIEGEDLQQCKILGKVVKLIRDF